MALTKVGNIALQQPYRKNFVMNGDFNIWQRQTVFNSLTTTTRVADRWSFSMVSDGVVNVTRNFFSSPSTYLDNNAFAGLQAAVATADTSIGTTQFACFAQSIEGYDAARIFGRQVTLSFYVYSNVTGTYCVAFRNSAVDRSYVAEYTINAQNTWEKKTITLTIHNTSSGTWDFTSGAGLQLAWSLACGTTYQTSANTWQSGNYLATSNQVNFLGTISNTFILTSVQLELGAIATPFEYRSFQEELSLCQRYYEKSYDYTTFAGAVASAGQVIGMRGNGAGTGTAFYKVTKRTALTPVVYSPATGASGNVRNANTGTDQAATINGNGMQSFTAYSASASISDIYFFNWVADAEF